MALGFWSWAVRIFLGEISCFTNVNKQIPDDKTITGAVYSTDCVRYQSIIVSQDYIENYSRMFLFVFKKFEPVGKIVVYTL